MSALSRLLSVLACHLALLAPAAGAGAEPKVVGIGVLVSASEGRIVIRKIIAGGPAEKDGRLQVDDVVTAVAQGKDGAFVEVTGKALSEVVDLIRGDEGTVVRLKVKPSHKNEPITVSLTRAKIPVSA